MPWRCKRSAEALLLGLVSALYFFVVGLLASRRLLWYDELSTLAVTRRPSLWNALTSGLEPNPPVFFAAATASVRMFGETELAARLPSMIGVWIFVICLYLFARRRVHPPFALLAALFPLATGALPYASESRPYGLLLGFTGLVLVCWQGATEGEHRGWWAVGLFLALVGALSTHFFAVLLWIPLGFAFLVRIFTRRRVDVLVAAALVLSPLILIAYRPIIANARTLGGAFWARPDPFLVVRFYGFLLDDALAPLVAVAAIGGLFAAWRRFTLPLPQGRREPEGGERTNLAPSPLAGEGWGGGDELPEELILLVTFLALPVFGVILGQLATGAFTERYALPAVAGFAVLFAFAASHWSGRKPVVATLLAVALTGGFLMNSARHYKWAVTIAAKEHRLHAQLLTDAPGTDPIVATDPVQFLQMMRYAPAELTSRLIYLTDGPDPNTAEVGLQRLAKFEPIQIDEYEHFQSTHSRFWLYRRLDTDELPKFPNELITRLSDRGVPMRVSQWTNEFLLLQCNPSLPLRRKPASSTIRDRF
jgi:hypothetical protein